MAADHEEDFEATDSTDFSGTVASNWPLLKWQDGNGFVHLETGYFSSCRVHCSECDAKKGTNHCYYPESACLNCGSFATKLRDNSGKGLPWKSWLKIKEQGRDRNRERFMRRMHRAID